MQQPWHLPRKRKAYHWPASAAFSHTPRIRTHGTRPHHTLRKAVQSAPTSSDAQRDPIVDTPMEVTLDALRPFDLNPRLTRNTLYDEIKASIRARGLNAPPTITRRPGDPHFIICNGGNTRLAILRELWRETEEERFFRIPCVFRPWSARGEIIALTGHLAENELHSGLTFIERALGIENARELYEAEVGKTLSQSELARRLAADGYPIPQPHISRMQDAVQYLLPAIPNLLYGGLGRPQVEKLTALRKAGERLWGKHANGKRPVADFHELFRAVLAQFDAAQDTFSTQRVQDELLGQIAERLGADYDALALELSETAARQRVLARAAPSIASITSIPEPAQSPVAAIRASVGPKTSQNTEQDLRRCIARLADEIAQEAQLVESVRVIETGIGFSCVDNRARQRSPFGRAVAALLHSLSAPPNGSLTPTLLPTETWTVLLQDSATRPRLSDAALTRLFRLIRLARRLLGTHSLAGQGSPHTVSQHGAFRCKNLTH